MNAQHKVSHQVGVPLPPLPDRVDQVLAVCRTKRATDLLAAQKGWVSNHRVEPTTLEHLREPERPMHRSAASAVGDLVRCQPAVCGEHGGVLPRSVENLPSNRCGLHE